MSTSALNRLRSLPTVFTLSMLAARLDGDKSKAAIYAKRWKDAGMIQPAGPRIGVYYNLIQDPHAAQQVYGALSLVFPEAVIAGETVLHDAGWTTQIPSNIQVIVLERRSLPALYGVDLHQRPASWFVEFADDIEREGFARLTAQAALVDAIGHGHYRGQRMWRPDVDDLESDDIAWDDVARCFERHKAALPSMYAHQIPRTWGRPNP